MTDPLDYRPVLAAYPASCQPRSITFLGSAGGFSGAVFWRIEAEQGTLCLRCWPPEHPSPQQLEFIQAVLWHVDQQGFHLVPVPLETIRHAGYVRSAERLWELAPWMPGRADYWESPNAVRLEGALDALARFHRAARGFPLPSDRADVSPGIASRLSELARFQAGGINRVEESIRPGVWPEINATARSILGLFRLAAPQVRQRLEQAATIAVDLQPCLRDIWHDHVLYQGDQVTGLIDFGALRADHVATDIARLLGSLSEDDHLAWSQGLDSYQRTRRLADGEIELVMTFDQSSVLMSGLNWLEWIFVEGRTFEHRKTIQARLESIAARLEHLVARSVR